MTTTPGQRERYCPTCQSWTPQRVIRKKLEWQCVGCGTVIKAPRSARAKKARP